MASLGVLTAGVAHEINNPLNFIMGAYQTIKSFLLIDAAMYYEKCAPLLNAMKLGIDRVVSIVRSLNQFSKDSISVSEICDIHAIIDNCLLMLQSQYEDRIRIVKNYSIQKPMIQGNIGKLHQVFTNILLNSIQAIESKGEIVINTEKHEGCIVITIQDNGCGIDKTILHRIVEPFFTTKAPSKGIGLGLSISFNIVKEHNGQLEFESEINVGTKAVLTFPLLSNI